MDDQTKDFKLKKYVTFWIIIYSIIIISFCILLKNIVPLWLFLSAMCGLTSVAITGFLLILIPGIYNYENNTQKTKQRLVLEDSLFHLLPLIISLLLFPILIKRVSINKNYLRRNFFGKCEPITSNTFFLSLIPLIFICIIYLSIYDPSQSYNNIAIDLEILVTLAFCILVSSYQIYFIWSQKILKFNV